jgi:hypothetical protein
VHGSAVVRREVILYVANKLGGAHLDHRRTSREETFRLLDKFREEFKLELSEKDVIYYELLSAGRALAGAPDISTLRNRLTELISST